MYILFHRPTPHPKHRAGDIITTPGGTATCCNGDNSNNYYRQFVEFVTGSDACSAYTDQRQSTGGCTSKDACQCKGGGIDLGDPASECSLDLNCCQIWPVDAGFIPIKIPKWYRTVCTTTGKQVLATVCNTFDGKGFCCLTNLLTAGSSCSLSMPTNFANWTDGTAGDSVIDDGTDHVNGPFKFICSVAQASEWEVDNSGHGMEWNMNQQGKNSKMYMGI